MTKANTAFRHVIYTGHHTQLVLMSIAPGDDIWLETHNGIDQFFRIDSGSGKAVIDGNEYTLSDWSGIIVPSGAKHNIINTSSTEPLKLYTLYSPPHHKDAITRKTKEEAEEDAPEFDGKTTE